MVDVSTLQDGGLKIASETMLLNEITHFPCMIHDVYFIMFGTADFLPIPMVCDGYMIMMHDVGNYT